MSENPSNPTSTGQSPQASVDLESVYLPENGYELPENLPESSQVYATFNKFLVQQDGELGKLLSKIDEQEQDKASADNALTDNATHFLTTSLLYQDYSEIELTCSAVLKKISEENQKIVTDLLADKETFQTSFGEAVGAIKAARTDLVDAANQACVVSTQSTSGKVETNLPKDYINSAKALEDDTSQLVLASRHIFNKFVKTAGLNGSLGLEGLKSSIDEVVEGLGKLDEDVTGNVTSFGNSLTEDRAALLEAERAELEAISQEKGSKQTQEVIYKTLEEIIGAQGLTTYKEWQDMAGPESPGKDVTTLDKVGALFQDLANPSTESSGIESLIDQLFRDGAPPAGGNGESETATQDMEIGSQNFSINPLESDAGSEEKKRKPRKPRGKKPDEPAST